MNGFAQLLRNMRTGYRRWRNRKAREKHYVRTWPRGNDYRD